MKWKNRDTNEIISIRKYNKLSDTEKKDWIEFDENKVEHGGDILNAMIGDFEQDVDD